MSTLRKACTLLLDEAERTIGHEVTTAAADDYWHIDPQSAYTLAGDLSASTYVGQLSDDMDELLALLERGAEYVYLWHDLGHLIGVLGFIAYLDLPSTRQATREK